jgi:DNA-binding MarR family transcriptional regulator
MCALRLPSSKPSSVQRATQLDALPLYLPRVFYAFLGVLERKLEETQLDRHLQPGMGHVLLRLYEGDNCIIKEIAQSTHMANATLTGLLRRMERNGLVRCRRCAEDGRAVRVSLTALGRALEPRLRDFHRQIAAIVEQGLAPEEVRLARSILGRILGSLRRAEEALRPVAAKSSRAKGALRGSSTRGREKPTKTKSHHHARPAARVGRGARRKPRAGARATGRESAS